MISPLIENYNKIKDDYALINSKLGGKKLTLKPYYDAFPIPTAPIEHLQRISFEKINVNVKTIAAISRLVSSAERLSGVITTRNKWLENNVSNDIDIQQRLAIFLGIPDVRGHVDRRYPDNIMAISGYTDDAIFFSNFACQELLLLSKKLAIDYTKKFHKKAPNINEIFFDSPEAQALIPSNESYLRWTSGFRERPQSEKRRLRLHWPISYSSK